MIRVLENQNFATAAELTKALNAERLKNKQKWLVYVGDVAGKRVEIKTFDASYPQIMRVNGIDHGGAMDLKVGAWKALIERSIG